MASPLAIPTSPDDPFYSQISELDGADYLLSFRYNQRERSWYISISTPEEIELVAGIKLVCNMPLLAYHRGADTPPGELMVISSDPTNLEDPAIGELGAGKRCELFYLPFGVTADSVT